MRIPRGFTLIEMVLALAIAAMLVAAVWTTTQSMAAVAARQHEAGTAEARLERFLSILRRDMQSRVVSSNAAEKQDVKGADTDLLAFDTLADSLAGYGAGKDGPSKLRRASSVKYTVHTGPGYYEIERVETGRGTSESRFALLRTNELPSIEFLEHGRWTGKPSAPMDTAAVRLRLNGQLICVAP